MGSYCMMHDTISRFSMHDTQMGSYCMVHDKISRFSMCDTQH